MFKTVLPVWSSTCIWGSPDTLWFLCLRAGVSSSLVTYICNGDPPLHVYCPTDLSLGKKILPWGPLSFVTQHIPFQMPWGHSDGFKTKHLGKEQCSPNKQQYSQASEGKQARQELVGGDGHKYNSQLLNHHTQCLITITLFQLLCA